MRSVSSTSHLIYLEVSGGKENRRDFGKNIFLKARKVGKEWNKGEKMSK